MRLTSDGRFERSDVWREGKWLDLWSVVHVLTGVSTAFGLSIFRFGFLASTLIALLGFIAYELWEAMVKIEETPQNRVMDVVVGAVSFIPAFLLIVPLFPMPQLIVVFSAILSVNIILSYIGWSASRKAEEFERRLRLELRKQRQHFVARRARFRAARNRRRINY